MPRKARVWTPGAIYHVDARGHCGAPIFASDEDRAFLVRRAARACEETDAVCLGWAALLNHYHLLLLCFGPPGATLARLNTALACRVLRARGEHGAVFQGRFFSGPCADDDALASRFAYVVANPIHHGVVPSVSDLVHWKWSSLGETLGIRDARLTDVEASLRLLGASQRAARDRLLRMLENKVATWRLRAQTSPSDEPPLDVGDAADGAAADGPDVGRDAVPDEDAWPPRPDGRDATAGVAGPTPPGRIELRAEFRLGEEPPSTVRNALDAEGWTLDALIRTACEVTGATHSAVTSGRRTPAAARARSLVVEVAHTLAGYRLVEISPALGVSASALVHARRRSREVVAALPFDAATVLDLSRERRGATSRTH